MNPTESSYCYYSSGLPREGEQAYEETRYSVSTRLLIYIAGSLLGWGLGAIALWFILLG